MISVEEHEYSSLFWQLLMILQDCINSDQINEENLLNLLSKMNGLSRAQWDSLSNTQPTSLSLTIPQMLQLLFVITKDSPHLKALHQELVIQSARFLEHTEDYFKLRARIFNLFSLCDAQSIDIIKEIIIQNKSTLPHPLNISFNTRETETLFHYVLFRWIRDINNQDLINLVNFAMEEIDSLSLSTNIAPFLVLVSMLQNAPKD